MNAQFKKGVLELIVLAAVEQKICMDMSWLQKFQK